MQTNNNSTQFTGRTLLTIDSEKPVKESYYVAAIDDNDRDLDEMRAFLHERREQREQQQAREPEIENIRHRLADITLNVIAHGTQQQQQQPHRRPHNNREAIQINLVDDEDEDDGRQQPRPQNQQAPVHGPRLTDQHGNEVDRRDIEMENIRRQMHEQSIQHEQQMRELRELLREQLQQTQVLVQTIQQQQQQHPQPQPQPLPQPNVQPRHSGGDANRANTIVCLTGVFKMGDHNEIADRLRAHGYTYSKSLTQQCSCLIRATPTEISSQKEDHAIMYGIPIYEADYLNELLQ